MLTELTEIIYQALQELTNDECPRCNYRGLVSDCVDQEDIEKWLVKQLKDEISESHQELNGQLRREVQHWKEESEIWKDLYEKELESERKNKS